LSADDDTPATAPIIAPPPLLFLAALVLGWGFQRLWPWPLLAPIPAAVRWPLAAVVLAFALGVAAAGIWRFRRARTPVEPWHPTTALVTDGVYDRVRNPMYLALLLLLVVLALATGGGWWLVAGAALAPVLHFGVVKREERYLEAKFGDAYRAYLARVPRWGWPR